MSSSTKEKEHNQAPTAHAAQVEGDNTQVGVEDQVPPYDQEEVESEALPLATAPNPGLESEESLPHNASGSSSISELPSEMVGGASSTEQVLLDQVFEPAEVVLKQSMEDASTSSLEEELGVVEVQDSSNDPATDSGALMLQISPLNQKRLSGATQLEMPKLEEDVETSSLSTKKMLELPGELWLPSEDETLTDSEKQKEIQRLVALAMEDPIALAALHGAVDEGDATFTEPVPENEDANEGSSSHSSSPDATGHRHDTSPSSVLVHPHTPQPSSHPPMTVPPGTYHSSASMSEHTSGVMPSVVTHTSYSRGGMPTMNVLGGHPYTHHYTPHDNHVVQEPVHGSTQAMGGHVMHSMESGYTLPMPTARTGTSYTPQDQIDVERLRIQQNLEASKRKDERVNRILSWVLYGLGCLALLIVVVLLIHFFFP
ncbi:MAG: hypothetical protein AAGJ35_10860, partial [Myxococcota bacterium]